MVELLPLLQLLLLLSLIQCRPKTKLCLLTTTGRLNDRPCNCYFCLHCSPFFFLSCNNVNYKLLFIYSFIWWEGERRRRRKKKGITVQCTGQSVSDFLVRLVLLFRPLFDTLSIRTIFFNIFFWWLLLYVPLNVVWSVSDWQWCRWLFNVTVWCQHFSYFCFWTILRRRVASISSSSSSSPPAAATATVMMAIWFVSHNRGNWCHCVTINTHLLFCRLLMFWLPFW